MRGSVSLALLGALLSSCAGTPFRQGRQEVEWFQSGIYGGVMFGRSDLDASGRDMDRELADRGYVTTTDFDDEDAAVNVYLGYRFEAPFAIELGYANLGRSESSIAAMPADVDQFLADVADVHPVLGKGIQIQGRWYAWSRERLELSLSAGLWAWQADVLATAGTGERDRFSPDSIDPTIGIALTIGVADRVDLRAAWDRYYLDGDAADALWLGIQIGLL